MTGRGHASRKGSSTAASAAAGIEIFLAEQRALVDARLPDLLPPKAAAADRVHDAMAYALLAPGKRIRPILSLAVASLLGGDPERVLPAACSVEMVHAASLVLDDLPSMDGASLRRGRPATHVAFGEATAILAAVALLNHAYGVVAGWAGHETAGPRVRAALARRFSEAIGTSGVIGGQQADLSADGRALTLHELEFVHSHKTGSLFIASAEAAALVVSASAGDLEALRHYAKNLGLAFQITDDVLDAEGTALRTGKDVRRDGNRTTFVTLCGVDGARQLGCELVDAAIAHLDRFGRRSQTLRDLALFVARRDR
ncbi:MAG: polyprenyl synthetase family protein [Acidobacteria bacterium]|nr:polyprenyl synthetase family protein [Acidobacteriota bacterium]